MAPTLSDGDIVLVRMGAQTRPGSVVLVRWAFRPHQLSIKRAACQRESGWQVIGDNSAASTDSRDWGPAEVLGVAAWRLWPKPWRGRIRE